MYRWLTQVGFFGNEDEKTRRGPCGRPWGGVATAHRQGTAGSHKGPLSPRHFCENGRMKEKWKAVSEEVQ